MDKVRVRLTVDAYEVVCAGCGTTYYAKRRDSKYCSQSCCYRAWARQHRPAGKPRPGRSRKNVSTSES